ncbi:hypothetical protein HAX54_002773, partial [Datura stramonium]|nr:hypothetical protein [Datura stramonium]
SFGRIKSNDDKSRGLSTTSALANYRKDSMVPTKVKSDGTKVPDTEDEFDVDDFRMMENNSKAIKDTYIGLALKNTTLSPMVQAKEILELSHFGS